MSNKKIGKHGAWCFDCGLDYDDEWPGDFCVPLHIWKEITPYSLEEDPSGQGGLLCANCMIRRLQDKGYIGVSWWPFDGLVDLRYVSQRLIMQINDELHQDEQ